MGDVLDNLFSVIPIVLAILWIMRRASRKKTTGKAERPEGAPARSGLSGRIQAIEAKAAKAARNFRDDFLGENREGVPPEDDKPVQRVEVRRVETAPPSPPPADSIERLVERRDDPAVDVNYSGKETSNSFERFGKLSPLAQGMIWSIILDKPPALKEPEN